MTKAKRGQDEPTIIKKYANRRLYDTGRSSYVTLDDLAEMIRDGYDFVVYDAKSGEDITHSVLSQIVLEKETTGNGPAMLPTSFMRNLISFYGDKMQGLVPNYLEATLDLFMKNQEQMREQINKSLEGMSNMQGMFQVPNMPSIPSMPTMPGMPGMDELNRQNIAMMERTMKMFTPFGVPGMKPGQSTATKTEGDKEQKMRELKQTIAEMQKELNRMAAE
jgi:polyhydroxyalkanoate synthesis repressor PhaR